MRNFPLAFWRNFLINFVAYCLKSKVFQNLRYHIKLFESRGWLAQKKNVYFVKICSDRLWFDSAYARNFSGSINYIRINVRLQFFANVTNSSTIYEANTVAIFPLSEKVVNNIEQPEEMGHAKAMMSCSTSSRHMERLTQL